VTLNIVDRWHNDGVNCGGFIVVCITCRNDVNVVKTRAFASRRFVGSFARVLPQLGQTDGTFLDAAVHCHTDCQSCCKNMVAVVSGGARARAVREQFGQTRFTGTDDSETSQQRIQRQLLVTDDGSGTLPGG